MSNWKLTASACAAVCAGAFSLTPALGAADGSAQQITRTVYASVLTKEGAVVTDMTAADFEVKEGGKVQAITVKPATAPLRVALLVADGGTGAFQAGIAQFVQKLLERGEFSIVSVLVQPDKLNDFSSDGRVLSRAIEGVGRRTQSSQGGQLLEAIDDAAKNTPAAGRRSVIVAMRTGREAPSTLRPNAVRERLVKGGTALYVVSIIGADRGAGSQRLGTGGGSLEAAQVREDELADNARNLQFVINDGASESGGRREEVVSNTFVRAMVEIADELAGQYEITYTLAEGAKPSEKLQVTSKRKNLRVHAPTKLAVN